MENKQPKMVFIAHWVENWNYLLWWFKFLHKHPQYRYLLIWFWPVYSLMSLVYLLGKKSFDVVDCFFFGQDEGRQIIGSTILTRNFGWHFFLPNQRSKIRQRIIDAVLYAQDWGADVIGLGALTKDERITQGGRWLVEHLGDRLRIPIVHGDTLTAAAVIRQILALVEKYQIKTPIFLTGSTSKIGRAVAIALARRGLKVQMFTTDEDRFKKIQDEAGESGGNLSWAEFLSQGSKSTLWVTGKSIPSSKELYRYIPEGGVVLNFAVPNPLSRRDFKRRKDLKVYEGGLLAYDPEKTTLRFTMRLKPGLTYACHAGTFVHAYKGWRDHEVGPVDVDKLDEVWQAAEELGFSLPQL